MGADKEKIEPEAQPNCYGVLYDKTVEDCKKCRMSAACGRALGLAKARAAKQASPTTQPTRRAPLNLRRRIRYFCFRCSPEREDCVAPDCPFYDLRRYNTGTPETLWKLPSRDWERAGSEAVRRRIATFEANKK